MDLLSLFRDFMDKGGDVLWAILFVAVWMWWTLLERFWYFFAEHKSVKKRAIELWQARSDHNSWYAEKQRTQYISEVECLMLKNLKVIPAQIALLPMFGLLGTVTGMIQVFDVMAFLGSGNPRSMADGVSAATIPTMAGMVVALVAIPFATALERRYRYELRSIKSSLAQRD